MLEFHGHENQPVDLINKNFWDIIVNGIIGFLLGSGELKKTCFLISKLKYIQEAFSFFKNVISLFEKHYNHKVLNLIILYLLSI